MQFVWIWAFIVAVAMSPLWAMRGNLDLAPLIVAYGSVPALFLFLATRRLKVLALVLIWLGLLMFAGLGFVLVDNMSTRHIMGDAGYVVGLWLHALPMLAGATAGIGMRCLALLSKRG